jgi:hypothetical protein
VSLEKIESSCVGQRRRHLILERRGVTLAKKVR